MGSASCGGRPAAPAWTSAGTRWLATCASPASRASAGAGTRRARPPAIGPPRGAPIWCSGRGAPRPSRTPCGFVYVSFITDVFSRRILGWKVSTDKREHLVLDALRMALTTRRRISSEFTRNGIIHHSDAGSQYTAIAFSEELEKEETLGSIGTVGDALDNALMESTIGLYKTELIGEGAAGRNWSSMREVERETAAWVRYPSITGLDNSSASAPNRSAAAARHSAPASSARPADRAAARAASPPARPCTAVNVRIAITEVGPTATIRVVVNRA